MGKKNSDISVNQKTTAQRAVKTVVVILAAILAVVVVFFIVCIFGIKSEFNLAGYSLHIINDQTSSVLPNGSLYVAKSFERGTAYVENDVVTFTDEQNNEVPGRIAEVMLNDTEPAGGENAEAEVKDEEDADSKESTSDTSATRYRIITATGEQVVEEVMISGTIPVFVPYIGYAINFVATPFGLVCCVAIPLFILLVVEIINLIRLPKSLKEEEFEAEKEDGTTKSFNSVPLEPQIMPISSDERFKPVPIGMQDTIASSVVKKQDSLSFEAKIEDINVISDASKNLFEDVEQSVELIGGSPDIQNISYEKPKSVTEPDKSDMQLTREYSITLPEQAPAKASEPAMRESVSQKHSGGFYADLKEKSPNRFQIDGIDVDVEPDGIKLSVDNVNQSRSISITVTKEYTNVVVGTAGNEVDFALFKDETDNEQKVIIRKHSN